MKHPRATPRRLLAATLGLMVVAALSAGVLDSRSAQADAESTRNVIKNKVEEIGTAAGVGAATGQALAFNGVVLPQIDVQVIAGDDYTKENSTQTATNTANIEQNAIAGSGDATASDGGTATSGSATAANLVLGLQYNIQVIAGNGCAVDQTASNTLNLTQDAAAISGDAEASNGGNASTGDASAVNAALIKQGNVQVYTCRNGGTGSQTAENFADFNQTTGAMSGNASADGGEASTGDARGFSGLKSWQSNVQIGKE